MVRIVAVEAIEKVTQAEQDVKRQKEAAAAESKQRIQAAQRAAQQLLEQGIPSGEAALRCGYQEYSTFSRAYKKQFDRSPSER